MPYVERSGGPVVGVYALPQYDGQEFLADNNAEVLAFVAPSAQVLLGRARAGAVALLASEQAEDARLMRALVLVLLDELNAHAAKINAILTAIDNGANLGAVKTNIAAITDYPTRTAQQVRTAIGNKITAGDADS